MRMKSKECVLCVDEMSLKSFLFFDFKKYEIISFHNTGFIKPCDVTKSVMVIMIPHSAFDTIDFINSMDTLFDIFNSHPNSFEVSNHEGSKRYSLPLSFIVLITLNTLKVLTVFKIYMMSYSVLKKPL